jgi:hypothetical protein
MTCTNSGPVSSIIPGFYPLPLEAEVVHAGRFVAALRRLLESATPPDDAAGLWLEGRPEEITVFVEDVLERWNAGALGTSAAARAIDAYLQSLHAALAVWYGQWFAPSCCGPLAAAGPEEIEPPPSTKKSRSQILLRRRGSADDTLTDARPMRASHVSVVSWGEIGNVR